MSDSLSAFSPAAFTAWLPAALPRSHIIRREIARGETVFRQGDHVAALCLLENGRIRLARVLEDGTSVTMHVAETGDSFAEASLSSDSYHCDAVAETNSVVWFIPKSDLLTALAADPTKSLALAAALARQVRDLRAKLELRNIRAAPTRLMAWFRLHANGSPPVVPIHRSWTLIADEVGLTREAVYRALASLEQQCLIRRRNNMIELLVSP